MRQSHETDQVKEAHTPAALPALPGGVERHRWSSLVAAWMSGHPWWLPRCLVIHGGRLDVVAFLGNCLNVAILHNYRDVMVILGFFLEVMVT